MAKNQSLEIAIADAQSYMAAMEPQSLFEPEEIASILRAAFLAQQAEAEQRESLYLAIDSVIEGVVERTMDHRGQAERPE